MLTSNPYQSPIILHHCGSCNINMYKPLSIKGTNYGAIYDASKHIFKVTDKVIVKLNSNKYQLEEYHFHIPGEHDVNGKIYAAEVHYVFAQLKRDEKCRPADYVCRNICCCNGDGNEESKQEDDNRNILVIGRTICTTNKDTDLSTIQVDLPSRYYMYDGSLTTGNYSPVRWIVGDEPIRLSFEEIEKFSKNARTIQSLDGRIILYSDNF